MRVAGLGLAALMFAGAPAAMAVQAPDLPAAQAFVTGLYAAYHGKGPDYLGRQAGAVFAPLLLRLIRRDATETPAGDVGALDGDPICDCQDAGVLRDVAVTITGEGPGRARAVVHFRLSRERRTVTLDLAAVQGHWRVSDVRTADTPSLVALLNQSLSGAHPKE
jgi:Protein of unknown function (DUF3828)